MYLIREETDASLPQIGAELGGRDHTTVLYGYERVRARLEHDDQLKREVMSLKEQLYNTKLGIVIQLLMINSILKVCYQVIRW